MRKCYPEVCWTWKYLQAKFTVGKDKACLNSEWVGNFFLTTATTTKNAQLNTQCR